MVEAAISSYQAYQVSAKQIIELLGAQKQGKLKFIFLKKRT